MSSKPCRISLCLPAWGLVRQRLSRGKGFSLCTQLISQRLLALKENVKEILSGSQGISNRIAPLRRGGQEEKQSVVAVALNQRGVKSTAGVAWCFVWWRRVPDKGKVDVEER